MARCAQAETPRTGGLSEPRGKRKKKRKRKDNEERKERNLKEESEGTQRRKVELGQLKFPLRAPTNLSPE